MWRSFHFDENTEMLDAYFMYIRQVAALLHYGKPQVLKVLKKYPSIKTVLGSLSNGRSKASSRNSKKNTYGKIDRQLAGQSFCTPFMNI